MSATNLMEATFYVGVGGSIAFQDGETYSWLYRTDQQWVFYRWFKTPGTDNGPKSLSNSLVVDPMCLACDKQRCCIVR